MTEFIGYAIFLAALTGLAWGLAIYMQRVFAGEPHLGARILGSVERGL